MILIKQFPDKSYSLNEILGDLKVDGLDMTLCYFYSPDGALNLTIKVDKAVHQSLICSWLISQSYIFTIESDSQHFQRCSSSHRYTLTPKQGTTPKTAIPVLCAGLMKTLGGKLEIRMFADAYGDRYTVVLETSGDAGLREICYALGMEVPQYTAPFGEISNTYNPSSPILSLPYSSPGSGRALTSGYGKDQTGTDSKKYDVTLGSIYNDVLDRHMCLSEENLQSSTVIYGAPGYGKSTLISSILHQMWCKKSIPFIVIEPKKEYRRLKRMIPELKVIRSLSGINPLIPPKGVLPQDYVNVVVDLMEMVSPTPADSSLRDYFRDAYLHTTGVKNTYAISEYIASYYEIMKERKYTGEALNFVTAGAHKMQNFFLSFCGPQYLQAKGRIPFENMRQAPIVIETGNVKSARMRGVYAYYLFQHIRSSLREESAKKIDLILVTEEAHCILDPSLPIETRREVGNSLAEDRAKGLCHLITDQSPSRLDQTQMCLAGNIVSFRVLSQQDRSIVSDQLGISPDQINDAQKQSCWIRTNTMYGPAQIEVKVSDEILYMTPLSDEECKNK